MRSPPPAGPNNLARHRQLFKGLTRYDTKRPHSWCRYLSPIANETRYTSYAGDRSVINPVSKNRG